jgi:hypothetical protein
VESQKIVALPHFSSLRMFLPFVFTIGGAYQQAALTQQTVAVVMVALFAIKTEQIGDVTFLHYHLSGFFP